MDEQASARVRVVGVGGGGCNAINRMIETHVQGVEFIVMNTDLPALERSFASLRLQLGPRATRGLGTGGKPERGQEAAIESRQEIRRLLEHSDMVFVTAGMGGGTGTGAAPVVAEIARDLGALTVGVVTRPFENEGPRRGRVADEGIIALREKVDALITIPNDRLRVVAERRLPLREAFKLADDVLRQGVQGISDIIHIPGDWNMDFADVQAIMTGAGTALMGIGVATGDNAAVDAAQAAISSPLLETSMQGAKGALINITASSDLGVEDFDEVSSLIRGISDPEDAFIKVGLVFDDSMGDMVKVTVVATGFGAAAGRSVTQQRAAIGREREQLAPAVPPPARQEPARPASPAPRQAAPAKKEAPLSPLHVLEQDRRLLRAMGDGEQDIPTFLRRK